MFHRTFWTTLFSKKRHLKTTTEGREKRAKEGKEKNHAQEKPLI